MRLDELVRSCKGDRTWQQVADATPSARDGGPQKPSWKTFELWANPRRPIVNVPDTETCRGAAIALGVTEARFFTACLESLGVPMTGETSSLLALMPAGTSDLDGDEQTVAALLSVIRATLRQRRAILAAEKPPKRPPRKST